VDNRGNYTTDASSYGIGLRLNHAGALAEHCEITGNNIGTIVAGTMNGMAVMVNGGTVRNTVVWGNANATDPDDLVKTGGTFAYSCTPLLPSGANDINNITDSETFAGRDRGLNAPWMLTTLDIAGNPRIHNKTVDIGAYELCAPHPTLLIVR